MLKKYDHARNGPGWAEIIFGAVLSVALGVVLGALLLILRAPEVLKQPPKEADRDPKKVYYVQGSRDSTKGKEAPAKRMAFSEGQTITVLEDHLNSFFPVSQVPKAPPSAPKPAVKGKASEKPAAPDGPAPETLVVGSPDFRISDGVLQIAVPVTVNILGVSQTVIAQTRGTFVKQDATFVYEPAEMFVGSCPVQRLPYVAEYVREQILNVPVPDDIKAGWSKLANVALDGKTLKLTVP
jgi:hypothetical protein